MFGRNNNRGGDHDGRPTCRFFLEGRCKFGDGCKNYHPRGQNTESSQQNRFAPLQNTAANNSVQRGRAGAFGGNDRSLPASPKAETFNVTTDNISADLTKERPIWPLSCYAPGLEAPRQLLEGALEQSFEEMRVQSYILQAQGKIQEYAQIEQTMLSQVQEQVQKILSDLNGARNYVVEAQHQHPNRIDECIRPTTEFPQMAPAVARTAGSGSFGQPSGFGTANSAVTNKGPAFGEPSAFGASSTPGGSAFGKPSNLGNGGAFGRPSPLGAGTAFGQPSTMGQTSTFGQPTAPSAFGAPSALGSAKPAFGQPSQPAGFGNQQQQQSSVASPFGQPSQPSAFGTARPSGTATAFGQPSGFGNQQSTTNSTTFGQPSGFGSNRPSPFAQAVQSQQSETAGPIGPSSHQTKPSPFGASANTSTAQSNPFGRQSTTTAFGSNPSGSPFGAQTTASQQSPFAQKQSSAPISSANGFGGISNSHAHPGSFAGKQLLQNEDGSQYYQRPDPMQPQKLQKIRVWFPNGPPTSHQPEAEGPAQAYEGDAGEELKRVYASMQQNGIFGDDLMPEIPPKREWIGWDL